MEYDLIATTTFGLESVAARELYNLGYDNVKVENGRAVFKGSYYDIAKCNIWLRTADRILIKLSEFKAESFEELFNGTLTLNWGDILPKNAFIHVTGKSVKSKLFSVSDCQSIVKKAIVERMKQKYKIEWFEEDGPEYRIEVSLLKDIVTLTLDTTGFGLHKRGYREVAGAAPLKETLAAGLVLLSRWDPSRVLADPLCGSGTIAIEAALIGRNIAPGLKRDFSAMKWEGYDNNVWNEVKEEAESKINNIDFRILASDIDGGVLKVARQNAKKAGIDLNVAFQTLNVKEFSSKKKRGCIITNPPYGERLLKEREVESLYRDMGKTFLSLNEWSFYILTAHPYFQKLFGRSANKNRKLYNGKIQCYFYMYF